MKELHFPPGKSLVTMPHAGIYQSLWEIYEQLGEARKKVSEATDKHGLISVHPEVQLSMRHRKFIASAARIYPALYIEAYLNFVAVKTKLQYGKKFERKSTAERLALCVKTQTGKDLDAKYIDFVMKIFQLRHSEVHLTTEEVIVGSEKIKPRYHTSLYRPCTLATVISSINKLVEEVHRSMTDKGYLLPVERLVAVNAEGLCHQDENAPFRIF